MKQKKNLNEKLSFFCNPSLETIDGDGMIAHLLQSKKKKNRFARESATTTY